MKESLKKNWPYLLVALIIGGGVTFGILKLTKANKGSSQQAISNDQFNQKGEAGGQGFAGRIGRGNFSPPTTGTIQTISGSTITLTATDNSTKSITTDSNTRFSKFDNGTRTTLALSDLKTGDQISVMGTSDSSGNITARMVFIGQMPTPQRRSSESGGFNNDNNLQQNYENPTSTEQL